MSELLVGRGRRLASLGLVTAGAIALGAAVTDLPGDRAAIPGIARQAVDRAPQVWHTPESVNAIVYGWRAFDTFGETFLLFAAVMSVVVVTRARERRRVYLEEERLAQRERDAHREHARRESSAEALEQGGESGRRGRRRADRIGEHGPVRAPEMSVVIRVGTRVLLPILAVAGVEIAVLGYTPGGGFPAGAVLLGVVIFAYVAFGYRAVRPVVRPMVLELGEIAGAAIIVGLGIAGLLAKGHLFANALPLAGYRTIFGGGLLQAFSGSEIIEVGTGLSIVVFSLLAMEDEWTGDEDGRR